MGIFSSILLPMGDILGDIAKPIGGIVGDLAGSLGLTNKPTGINYNIDPNAFINEYSSADRQSLQNALLAQQNKTLQDDQIRQQQLALTQALQDQAAQQAGPSIAEMQMQRGAEDAVKQQAAALASNRAVNAGLGARLAGQAGANMQQQNVANTSLLRAQEDAQRRAEIQNSMVNAANVLSGVRQADITSQGQQQGLQNDMIKYYQQTLLDQAERDRQAQIMQQQLGMSLASGNASLINQQNQANSAMLSKIYQGAGSALAGGALPSGGASAPAASGSMDLTKTGSSALTMPVW